MSDSKSRKVILIDAHKTSTSLITETIPTLSTTSSLYSSRGSESSIEQASEPSIEQESERALKQNHEVEPYLTPHIINIDEDSFADTISLNH